MRLIVQRSFALCLLLTAFTNHAQAAAIQAPIHDLRDVQQSAEKHLLSLLPPDRLQHRVQAQRLDDRLRLAPCNVPLQPFLPNGAALGVKATVAVRCPAADGWTIYVPVAIETDLPALLLTRSIARGGSIGAQDVEVRTQTIAGMGAAILSDVRELAGMHARRDLAAGTVLSPAMLEPDTLIKRGQQVTLLAAAGGIEVRSQGIALSDGSANSRIRVRNLNSAKVVEGLVDNQSQVRVQL